MTSFTSQTDHSVVQRGHGLDGGTPAQPGKPESDHSPVFSPSFKPIDSVRTIWTALDMAPADLESLDIGDGQSTLASSFKVGHIAQASISLATLAAVTLSSDRLSRSDSSSPTSHDAQTPAPRISVPLHHASLAFRSELLTRLDGHPPPPAWGVIGGLYAVSDGHIRVHDTFVNHRHAFLEILGFSEDEYDQVRKPDVAERLRTWRKMDVERAAHAGKAVAYTLRSREEYLAECGEPQPRIPIRLAQIAPGPLHTSPTYASASPATINTRPLAGVRVLELSRVVAAPVAGRALAAFGADVLWVTSPNLPDIPSIDRDFARGKRAAQLDLNDPADLDKLKELIRSADVFLQSYRPEALAKRGLGVEDVAKINPGIVYASLSAWDTEHPWASRRGYDSLVQTSSGLNAAEAEAYAAYQSHHANQAAASAPEAARVLPCQALDHASGYLLAAGILSALHRRATEGGAWNVHVTLAGTMEWLTSLGRVPDGFSAQGIDLADIDSPGVKPYLETRSSGLGELTALTFPASVEGVSVGWDVMPKPPGSDAPEWV